MNYIDIIIFAFLVLSFFLGFKDGIVRKAIGLVGLILAIVLAIELSGVIGNLLSPIFDDQNYIAEIISGLIIFIAIIILTSIVKKIIQPVDRVNKLFNQILGGLAGLVQAVIYLSGLLLFLNIFNFPKADVRNDSLLYNDVYNIIPSGIELIVGENSKTDKWIKEFIQQNNGVEQDSTKR
ncbi:MAG: CvpA family protein [Ignavibacteriales bacterium]|nr:CvpA family protein [Ignavibacteriales bacterium]